MPRAILILALLVTASVVQSQPTDEVSSGAMRRLTEAQYRNAVSDIFGPDIRVAGRIDPLQRPPHGLQVSGVSRISVSAAGLEQYVRMARAIADQALDERHRRHMVACEPRQVDAPDDRCAAQFFGRLGPLVFRRPLSAADVEALVRAAGESTRLSQDFYTGLAHGLETLLVSPRFLFDIDGTEPDPTAPGRRRLDGYSKASRLSFFLWDTTPDQELLNAAGRGDLHTEEGLTIQVDRLLASPRVEQAVRALFTDMLGFERIADLAKDPVIYPQFVRTVKADMQEQTLRTIVHHLLDVDGDYRDLLTTRQTFMSRALGTIYRLPVPAEGNAWTAYELPEDGPRAGLLSQVSFLAAFSHDGRSSPTLRGRAIRELLLCQPVPEPPADVNFSAVEDTTSTKRPTARDRLTPHRTRRACASCHQIVDPIGLSLENFDGVGAYRTEENGTRIDASGDLDGVQFADPVALAEAVRNHPALPSCFVNRVAEYAMRRSLIDRDAPWVDELTAAFASREYRVRALFREVATSDAFHAPPFDAARETAP